MPKSTFKEAVKSEQLVNLLGARDQQLDRVSKQAFHAVTSTIGH